MAKSIISFEISDALKSALKLEAFKRNKTVSATIREMLKERLDQQVIKEEKVDTKNER